MITLEKFIERVGREPEYDDLERCNCSQAGECLHHSCGWCDDCDMPKFLCECSVRRLRGSGVFEDQKISSNCFKYTFSVEEASPEQCIPNVGVLPASRDGAISFVFEDKVPAKLQEYILTRLEGEYQGQIMSQEFYHYMLSRCMYELNKLASEGLLFRGLVDGEWAFRQEGEQ